MARQRLPWHRLSCCGTAGTELPLPDPGPLYPRPETRSSRGKGKNVGYREERHPAPFPPVLATARRRFFDTTSRCDGTMTLVTWGRAPVLHLPVIVIVISDDRMEKLPYD